MLCSKLATSFVRSSQLEFVTKNVHCTLRLPSVQTFVDIVFFVFVRCKYFVYFIALFN